MSRYVVVTITPRKSYRVVTDRLDRATLAAPLAAYLCRCKNVKAFGCRGDGGVAAISTAGARTDSSQVGETVRLSGHQPTLWPPLFVVFPASAFRFGVLNTNHFHATLGCNRLVKSS